MKILALDTATEGCSVAVWIDGEVRSREIELERGHAGVILKMIDELLAEAGLTLASMSVIGFGRGPGSFTGVRLAASVTQGLAWGAGLPVVPVSDLRAMAQQALGNDEAADRVLVCNDARMREVYSGCFARGTDGCALQVTAEQVGKAAHVCVPPTWTQSVLGVGRGFATDGEFPAAVLSSLKAVDSRMLPRAREIAVLAAVEVRAGRVLPAEEAMPVYLRDNVAQPNAPLS